MKALIIGAGIGGLSAAIALRRVGIESKVFEQAEQLREVGAGLTFWTSGLNAMASLGVADSVIAAATIVKRFEQRTWRGSLLNALQWSNVVGKEGRPAAICVHRRELLAQLARVVDPQSIHCGHACIAIEEDSRGVTARFGNGREAHGDMLIGADGLHSVIRKLLHGAAKPRYAGYTCWRGVAKYDGKSLPADTAFEAWGPGQRFAAHHLGDGRVFWYGTKNCAEGGIDGVGGRKADALECFNNWAAPVPEIIGASEENILRNDIVDRKPIKNWGSGHVTLLGDAAHPTTPNLGHGACMAIQDAVVLGDCLRQASSAQAGLRSYEKKREQKTAHIVNQSWWVGVTGQFENPVARALMNAFARGIPPALALKLMERIFNEDVPTLPNPAV